MWRMPSKRRTVRVIGDAVILTVMLWLAFNFSSFWPRPISRRGFFCGDESLGYPYMPDTVSGGLLYLMGFYVPLAAIAALEILLFVRLIWIKGELVSIEKLDIYVGMPYKWLRRFLFGFAVERTLKDIGKYTIGRLRPIFMAVCAPQFADGSSCADERNQGRYHMDYSCSNAESSAAMLSNIRKSFPSGHSSLSFYGMIFMIFYLHRRLRNGNDSWKSSLLCPLLQFACLGWAWFVALSRIMDNRHHWSDVLAGSLLGATVASMAAMYKTKLKLTFFEVAETKTERCSGNEQLQTIKMLGQQAV